MKPAALSDASKALAKEALADVPHGAKTAATKRVAKQLGVSPATLYRVVGDGPARPREPDKSEYRQWVRIAVAIAHESPDPAPLEIAIEAGVEGGDLPPEAAQMPLGTAYRITKELGLVPAARRTPRISADFPMQALAIDASTSKYLTIDPRADPDDDDPPLVLHRAPTPARGYKNKPLPPDRRRLMVYGVWDMCTGYIRSRYVAARGENALDAMDFLCWALAEHPDRRVVMHGIPDDLWSDRGPLIRNKAATALLERLDPGRAAGAEEKGIVPCLGAPYNKTRNGGVERAHRTRWRSFERGLFLWRRRPKALRLSDLNTRLLEFEIRENGRRQSRTRVDGRRLSRAAAWVALVARRPADRPLRRLPDSPMETLAIEAHRRVGQGGLVHWGGLLYEAPWHSRKVIAYRAADGSGDITLEDKETKERCVARLYEQPRPYGDIRAGAQTPLDRHLADPAREQLAGADIWAPAKDSSKVVPMPAPAAAAPPLENPLPAGIARCRDLDEAWRVFISVYPWLVQPELRERIARRFEALDLDRAAIVELAQEFIAAAAEGARASTGGTR